MTGVYHSIKIVAKKTGLSAHVIRVWEKRYGAVEPQRTVTNRRRYSDAEIERLSFLRQATAAGHSIGHIANLPTSELQRLVSNAEVGEPAPDRKRGSDSPAQSFHDSCLAAVKELDGNSLDEALQRALIALGHQGLLRQVAGPLAQTIGELWRSGVVTAAHEHFLTARLTIFLGRLSGEFPISALAPRIIVATPAGQVHELGAVIVNAAAAQMGWRTTYLGASLPAAEIAGAARQRQVAVVALSIVYPEDDPTLPQELINLHRFLPSGTKILAGGRAAPGYRETLRQIGAELTESIDEFCTRLDDLRRSPRTKSE